MNSKSALPEKLKESLTSVLPVAMFVVVLYLTPLVSLSFYELIVFLASTVCLVIGIGLFNLGADIAMSPMGEYIGTGLTKSKKVMVLLSVSLLMGILITIAEPDLSVLASQVSGVIHPVVLIVTVGVGVGIFLMLGVIKIVFKHDQNALMLLFYMIIFALVALLFERGKSVFLPLSFDSGGVTTGPITVPFLMALGIGIARTIGGRKSQENSFGLVAMCSIGPVLALLVLSIMAKGDFNYSVQEYGVSADIFDTVSDELWIVTKEVAFALGLIVVFFLILQFAILKMSPKSLVQIFVGIVYTFVGLVIFLTSVTVGYMPIGFEIGCDLANFSDEAAIIVAFLLGMLTVLAEPAIHVLNQQVEEVTNGNVSRKQMMLALCIGVGLSVGLSVLRAALGFSVLYYLIPGYVISLALSFFVPKLYTAIAFDSGGVASGPLTSSFVLPLVIGASVVMRGENSVLEFAFGVVAMVAMTPLIAIQLLGFRAVVAKKARKKIAMRRILSAEKEQIIYFNWEDA